MYTCIGIDICYDHVKAYLLTNYNLSLTNSAIDHCSYFISVVNHLFLKETNRRLPIPAV